ncbi:MAG: hypothetical protein QOF63_4343 [Thermoanaerobaculia bacterium]|jgi:hypothetical protein|nr:hypothetical protein [Thermoanaerobaculia bacterium]
MADQTQNNGTLTTNDVEGSYWEEFNRIQRAAQALLNRPLSPKGVFRFRTHEEFEEWKKIHEAELPGMDSIRQFLRGQLDS